MEDVLITTKCGTLKGKIETDYKGNAYYSFRGIPYAKPPLGNLRFMAPLPPDPWDGVWDATKHGEICCSKLQGHDNVDGSENCLFLNVYTPNFGNQSLLPVMCWIHGGGNVSGSGNSGWYGPDYLLTENVLLVTINYRVGLLGLFHKAIMQSGTLFGSWSDGKRSLDYLETIFNIKASEETFLKLLQKMSVAELMLLQSKIPDRHTADSQRPFGPVVERHTSEFSFLLEEPLTILRSGTYNDVPLMVGYTSRECLAIHFMNRNVNVPNKGLDIITDFELEIPRTINAIKGTSLSKSMAEKIKFFYLGNKEWSDENKTQYYLLKTDAMFIWPIQKSLRYHANYSTNPIYFYRMSLDTSINLFKRLINIKLPGASHADEIGYLFNNSRASLPIPNSLEMKGIERFTKLWTNFARTGNPNPTESTSLIDVHWKPIDKCKLHYLEIGENLTVGVNPDEDRVAFWDKLELSSLGNSKL